ncbi:MAG TPA: pyridoxamine 5'-phosphate oxidase family protein [Acidimicrobiia bacterium]|jgi:general stress protein 26|nr:pyridoxamine 5'-phosphate oxidase family protein [Acidimicrobiia bacterium]
MTPAEVDAFLRRHHTMALATHGPGGFPHVVAMSYGFVGDRLAFWGDRRSQKIVNLQRDRRLGCLVDEGIDHGELRGVHLAGVAEFVTGPEELADLGRAILAQRFGPAEPEGFPVPLSQLVARRVGVRVRVERTVSWDHGQPR